MALGHANYIFLTLNWLDNSLVQRSYVQIRLEIAYIIEEGQFFCGFVSEHDEVLSNVLSFLLSPS